MSSSYEMKDGWDFVVKSQSSHWAGQMGLQYVSRVDSAIQQLAQDMNSKIGNLQDVAQLKGFIAEIWHADTFNIDAALKGSSNKAFIENSNAQASVDISTNFDMAYSLKYYATGKDSVINQSKNVIQAYNEYLNKCKSDNPLSLEEYIEKYGYSADMSELLQSVYRGQERIIPSDQLDEAIKFLERQIAKEASKEGPNRAAVLANYQETLKMLSDRIRDNDGVTSTPLTKEEAEAIAALCKIGEFKPEDFGFSLKDLITTEYILQQALKAGYTSAVISLVMQIGPELFKAIDYLIKNGKINTEDLKRTGMKSITASAEGFLRGAISASITIACHAGKLGEQLINISPGAIGAVTMIVLDTMKNSCMVACGRMSSREMELYLTKELIISSVSLAGGTIGQTLLAELPVLGYMIGSFVGSIVASVTINASEKTILSFCADTGFSFWGLVDQDYQLPDGISESLGVDVMTLSVVDIKQTDVERISIPTVNIKRTKYDTIKIKVLRRGVVSVNKIGYIL